MTKWLISANPAMYNHSAAFAKWGFVDWIQFANYEIGDIVYIYASNKEGVIRYKTLVTKNNMTVDEIEKDDSFWYDSHDLRREDAKYSRLKLIKRLDNHRLKFSYLKSHGLLNAPQRAKKLDGELLAYIERESQDEVFDSSLVGSQKDGNIAIKCNYCDGGKNANHIGFAGVCSDRIIRYNIEEEHRVWCNNVRCPCFQYHNRKISRSRLEEIMSTPSEFVCYESTMLSDWKTQAGLYEDGRTKSFGSTLHTGAVCVFTTRLPDMDERDRFIFGMFIIDELFHGNSNKSGYVKCNTDYHIELTPEESRRIKFWNYYRNKNTPERELWGTGLYRFISNNSIVAILSVLINMRSDDKRDEAVRFLAEFCRLNNLKMPDKGVPIDVEFEKKSNSTRSNVNLNRDNFIEALNLPDGFEAKRFEGMNRVHFKYNGVGFAVIDMKNDGYNLGTREKYLDDVGITDYGITQNLGPNRAIIKDIPYNDTDALYRLFNYISGESFETGGFVLQELKLEAQSIEDDIQSSNLVGMDKVAVVKARVNQGVFRDRLIRKYGKCCLCGADEESLLIASHIKPWVDSSPEERVDENNGLLLCPNHDRLFDRGFISFDDDGTIMISKSLSDNNCIFLNVNQDAGIVLDDATKKYMEYHRNYIYMDREDAVTDRDIDEEKAPDKIESGLSSPVSVETKNAGPFPECLLNVAVEDVKYGDGIIISIDSRKFELEVSFDDEIENKTFIFPDCFLRKRLSVKDEVIQIGLTKHLQNYM